MKISASITEFPLYSKQETFFREFKRLGIDGVEVDINFKNVWRLHHLLQLSKEYHLPITSFHQSIWSGFGFSFDERFIQKAKEAGITVFTFHPLTFTSFDSQNMKRYLSYLSELQNIYQITICLENMRKEYLYKNLHTAPYQSMDLHLKKLFDVANEYDLSITYDTSHARNPKPQETEIFNTIFPKIKNIHLSSFREKEEHLALDKGEFDINGFIEFLEEKSYSGLLTFEINYSLLKMMIFPYDFSEVARSVELIRSLSDR